MTRPIAVYTDVVGTDPQPGIELLEAAGFEVRVASSADPAMIAQTAQDAQALLIGYSPVDAELLDRLGELRIVATQSVGFDMVDTEAAAHRGIWVSNVPAAATEEVATHAFAMALSLMRGLPFLDRDVRAGNWNVSNEKPRRLSETTVGVVGLGRIGARFASLIRPAVGTVLGFDPFLDVPDGVESVALPELFARSELISLHLPLSAGTAGLVNAATLALMPRGSFLVNVSRGGLVDHGALAHALDSGQLGGAALDVLAVEPPDAADAMVGHPRVLLSPHAAYLSAESARDYVLQQAENVVSWHHRQIPKNPVNTPLVAQFTA
ncbi:C-terminal binding protein [Arthrobacter sp. LAPM80]|uniref:C-terminal binding protein n=1 Tax=Arthrobacter sp. LAPM80 TaxID=3141788 RepID=UPI00398AD4EB